MLSLVSIGLLVMRRPRKSLMPVTRIFLALTVASLSAVYVDDKTKAVLLPYGPEEGDQLLNAEAGDDAPLNSAMTLAHPFLYSEHRHNELYVSRNGVVSFSAPLSESAPKDLDMERKDIIAVFYASAVGGNVYSRSSAHADSLFCREISAKIRRAFTDSNGFEAKLTLLITWENTWNIERTGSNIFQLALATNERESYAVFVYNRIEWSQSNMRYAQAGFFSADGRSEKLINSGTSAIAKLTTFTNDLERGLFLYRISGTQPLDPRRNAAEDYEYDKQDEEEYDPNNPAPLTPCPPDPYKDNCPLHCNIIDDSNGCTVCVCPTVLPDNSAVPSYSKVSVNDVNADDAFDGRAEVPLQMQPVLLRAADLACSLGDSPTQCHPTARCEIPSTMDGGHLGCCLCPVNQIGNGVECLTPAGSIRISGTFEAALNGQRVERIELYSFILPTDGQQHTALANIPKQLGAGVTLLDTIGTAFGWLFAKTSDVVELPNGFQMTGGAFNRTVKVQLGDRYEVLIHQVFADRQNGDAFGVSVDVSGTLPELPLPFSVESFDYEETYRRGAPGIIYGNAERVVSIVSEDGQRQDFRIVVDQQIQFAECPHRRPVDPEQVIRYERVNNQFGTVDGVVRFASRAVVVDPQSAKIAASATSSNSVMNPIINPPRASDPCASGAHVCSQPNMLCRAYGPSYRCECHSGYSVEHDNSTLAGFRCVDIDECIRREHNCDANAICINTAGRFSCACRDGFVGDGHACARIGGDSPLAAGPRGTATARGVTTIGGESASPCTKHDDCHRFGECVFGAAIAGSTTMGVCRCRGWYVGDGVSHCGEPEETIIAPTATGHEPTITTSLGQVCSGDDQCGPSAACQYDSAFGHYVCRCKPPFRGDGRDCVLEITSSAEDRACETRLRCHARARCVANGAQPICQCIDDYRGDGIFCAPNDPAAEFLSPPIIPSSLLNDDSIDASTASATAASAPPSVAGIGLSKKQCANQTECHTDASCVLVADDKYICQCLPGYAGDGFNDCTLAEECSPSTPNSCYPHAECQLSEAEQRFTCQCRQGFTKFGDSCVALSPVQAAAVANASVAAPKPFVPSCLQDRSLCSPQAECVPDEHDNYVCNCKYGYRGNGRTCQSVSELYDRTLLIGRGMSVIQRPTKLDVPGKQLVVVPHQVVVDLAYDCMDQRVYWSDIAGHTLRSVALNGTDMRAAFTTELRSPEGIAVDWSSRNLYYVDSLKNELGVLSLDGRYQKTLLSEGLVNPRAMAIDVEGRHLYYSDWQRGNAHIGRVDLDGTNNQVFLSMDIHLPNGLALLPRRRELCWVDAGNQRLSCIRLDGNSRRVVYQRLEYPFGLTCFNEERFYWTDWKDHKIHTVSVYGDGYASFLPGAGGRGKIYGLINVPQTCHGAPTECAKDNGGCSQLCLPSRTAPEGRVCKCADNAAVGTCA